MGRNPIEPHLFIILGGTGDLTQRKLLPALYRLTAQGILNDRSRILGVARDSNLSDQSFRNWAREALATAGVSGKEMTANWCDQCVYYQPIGVGSEGDYRSLLARVQELERKYNIAGNRAFYLALPPDAFPTTIRGLGQVGLNQSSGWTRLVIEKPFGHDLASAQELNRLVHTDFNESQIYRIDHYLGKETVQNLLVFRFANAIFESLWNRDRVESIEITVAEDLGIEKRAHYYEHAGALRDMVQNHLTQLLTLVAMEVPPSFEADAIRTEKIKVLHTVMPIRPEEVVLGQYTRGKIDGQEVPGYREEPGVAPDSNTETSVAFRVEIDNWRWQGVPFYLRTGKRLPRRLTQIAVTFRSPPICLFQSLDGCQIHPNVLTITLQPDEGFDLFFEVKAPVQPVKIKTQRLHFRYTEAFGPLPEAYETLLLDVLTGDQTLFVHADEVEASWRLFAPLLEQKPQVHEYAAGSWGPPEADQITDREGRRWQTL
ncbi:glucose-6-phosphate dehydrogenase [candidate division TA06 bacterium]|nr:glucose-6-phosphate dehydrogenase [candidate division TA06 bacterium]